MSRTKQSARKSRGHSTAGQLPKKSKKRDKQNVAPVSSHAIRGNEDGAMPPKMALNDAGGGKDNHQRKKARQKRGLEQSEDGRVINNDAMPPKTQFGFVTSNNSERTRTAYPADSDNENPLSLRMCITPSASKRGHNPLALDEHARRHETGQDRARDTADAFEKSAFNEKVGLQQTKTATINDLEKFADNFKPPAKMITAATGKEVTCVTAGKGKSGQAPIKIDLKRGELDRSQDVIRDLESTHTHTNSKQPQSTPSRQTASLPSTPPHPQVHIPRTPARHSRAPVIELSCDNSSDSDIDEEDPLTDLERALESTQTDPMRQTRKRERSSSSSLQLHGVGQQNYQQPPSKRFKVESSSPAAHSDAKSLIIRTHYQQPSSFPRSPSGDLSDDMSMHTCDETLQQGVVGAVVEPDVPIGTRFAQPSTSAGASVEINNAMLASEQKEHRSKRSQDGEDGAPEFNNTSNNDKVKDIQTATLKEEQKQPKKPPAQSSEQRALKRREKKRRRREREQRQQAAAEVQSAEANQKAQTGKAVSKKQEVRDALFQVAATTFNETHDIKMIRKSFKKALESIEQEHSRFEKDKSKAQNAREQERGHQTQAHEKARVAKEQKKRKETKEEKRDRPPKGKGEKSRGEPEDGGAGKKRNPKVQHLDRHSKAYHVRKVGQNKAMKEPGIKTEQK